MLHKTPARLFRLGLLFTLTAYALTVNAQNPPAPDKEMDHVQAMIAQSKKDAEQFSKSGGKPGDANDPNLKWSAALWQYREKHPGTPATVTARATVGGKHSPAPFGRADTGAARHLLARAARVGL